MKLPAPRLRQAVLVARDLDAVSEQVRRGLGLGEPFHDEGVATFGLANSVFAVGDTFLEVVSPIQEGTTAGRYLESHGGDSGYMAMFQVPDMEETENRIADLGMRTVWRGDYPDISGRHLHPKDIGGAIVSLDWADPPDSWRWAGPEWTAKSPKHAPGGIVGMSLRVADPPGVAARWASILGESVDTEDGGATIMLAHHGQRVDFKPLDGDANEGITEVAVEGFGGGEDIEIAGVLFRSGRI